MSIFLEFCSLGKNKSDREKILFCGDERKTAKNKSKNGNRKNYGGKNVFVNFSCVPKGKKDRGYRRLEI